MELQLVMQKALQMDQQKDYLWDFPKVFQMVDLMVEQWAVLKADLTACQRVPLKALLRAHLTDHL